MAVNATEELLYLLMSTGIEFTEAQVQAVEQELQAIREERETYKFTGSSMNHFKALELEETRLRKSLETIKN